MRGNVTVSNPVFSGFLATLTPQLPSTSSLGAQGTHALQIPGQAHQAPFPTGLVQPAQEKLAKAQDGLMMPNTGSTACFRRA
jgi:hypothetical protein